MKSVWPLLSDSLRNRVTDEDPPRYNFAMPAMHEEGDNKHPTSEAYPQAGESLSVSFGGGIVIVMLLLLSCAGSSSSLPYEVHGFLQQDLRLKTVTAPLLEMQTGMRTSRNQSNRKAIQETSLPLEVKRRIVINGTLISQLAHSKVIAK